MTPSKAVALQHKVLVPAKWLVDSVHHNKLAHPKDYHVQGSPKKPKVTLNFSPQSLEHAKSSLTDPNFVKNFFKNSRLHYIGSWKEHFEGIAESFKQSVPRFKSPRSSDKRIVVHIDLDCFFASVAIRNRPELVDKPVAVSHSSSAGTGEISTCNYIARSFGVHSGMYMKKALDLCPNLVVVPYLFEEYTQVSDEIYTIFYQVTHALQPVSCDECYFELPYQDETMESFSCPEEVLDFINSIRKQVYE